MKAEFFILGALHRGDLHPYEIKRRLSNALVECYTDVDVGTLYYAVRQLVRSGDIAQKTRQKVARGGERTIYRITPQGRKRFQELLLDRFQEKGTVAQTIYPALLFLHLAQLPAVAELLRERLRQTESAMAKIRAIKEQFGAVLGSGNCYLMDHLIEVRRLDRQWLRRLLSKVQTGKVRAPRLPQSSSYSRSRRVRNNPLKKKMWRQTERLVRRLLLIAALSGPSVVLGHETLPAPRAFLLVISGK